MGHVILLRSPMFYNTKQFLRLLLYTYFSSTVNTALFIPFDASTVNT